MYICGYMYFAETDLFSQSKHNLLFFRCFLYAVKLNKNQHKREVSKMTS